MRCGLLSGTFLAQSLESLLAQHQAVQCAWNTPVRQHRQRATASFADATPNQNPIMNAIMSLTMPPPMTDDCDLVARRTSSGQPFPGLASIAGTWDKDDHG